MKSWKLLSLGLLALTLLAACGQAKNTETAPHQEEISAHGEQEKKRTLKKIGVQLYTVRGEMEKDFEGTLRKIAALGFDEVEFAGLFGNDPRDVRKLLDELGLDPVASHVNWEKFKNDPDPLIEETAALGAKYMILAWLPEEERQSLDSWREWVTRLNVAGKKAHERGITMAFHNHDFEFVEIDGVRPYDIIMEGIDRRYVKLELDLYWASLVGVDPNAYFVQYQDGFPLSHVKDLSADKKMVDVGQGQIDFATIFAAAEKAGMKHFIVEHDNPEDPLKSIENSITYLRTLEY